MGDEQVEGVKKWIEDMAEGRIGHDLENLTLQGLRVVQGQRGFFLYNFVVPRHLTDRDGNWHTGAIATLIDNVGSTAISSSVLRGFKSSINFNISYFSTVKIEEEVEIEARVLGHKGNLASMIVTIRKKENGEMVALGKQWMISRPWHNNKPTQPPPSKL